MPRVRSLAAIASLLCLGFAATRVRAAASCGATSPRAAGASTSATPTPSPSPRVFTNDDLEAARKKGGVQDLRAKGMEPYEPPPPLEEPQVPTVEPTPEIDPQSQRIADLEAQIKMLDDSAKALLWQYLQSTDTNEILRLKAEQQDVLTQLDAAKAELAQLKAESAGRPALPTPTPTPPPG